MRLGMSGFIETRPTFANKTFQGENQKNPRCKAFSQREKFENIFMCVEENVTKLSDYVAEVTQAFLPVVLQLQVGIPVSAIRK